MTRPKSAPAMVGQMVQCDADYDILIAAGGDGTINQVVNELVEQDAPKDTCLAVLPLGTANDFATSLTIHDDNLVQAMQTAVRGISLLLESRGLCLTCQTWACLLCCIPTKRHNAMLQPCL